MRHSCRKAATPPVCSGVSVCCLWFCCRARTARDEPIPPPASAGSRWSRLLRAKNRSRSAPWGRGEAGSSLGSAASPDLLGLCRTSSPSKFLVDTEQQLQDPLLRLSRDVSAAPWARGVGRAAPALLCAKLSWFGATGPSYHVAAPLGTAGRSVGFHPASPDFCSRGYPTGSIFPQHPQARGAEQSRALPVSPNLIVYLHSVFPARGKGWRRGRAVGELRPRARQPPHAAGRSERQQQDQGGRARRGGFRVSSSPLAACCEGR